MAEMTIKKGTQNNSFSYNDSENNLTVEGNYTVNVGYNQIVAVTGVVRHDGVQIANVNTSCANGILKYQEYNMEAKNVLLVAKAVQGMAAKLEDSINANTAGVDSTDKRQNR